MPCLRTPSTSSNPNAFEPTSEISLKYSGVSSQNVGPCTPAFTSVPAAPAARARRPRTSPACRSCRRRRRSRPGYAIGRPSLGCSTPPDHAAASSITCDRGLVADHGRAELARELGLRLEARDHEHLDVGVQRAQDRGRARAERAGAVDHRLAAGRRWVARDRVQRHRERVGEHRELVGHVVGHLEQHRVVRGHQLGVAAARVLRRADVDAGRDRADAEDPAQAVVADLRTPGTSASTPRGPHDSHGFSTTRSPTSRPSASGPSATTSATTSCPSTCGSEKNPFIGLSGLPHLAPVHEHLLGVGAADAGEPRLGDHPVGQQEPGVVHVDELHRRVAQRLQQREPRRVLVERGLGLGRDPVQQCLQRTCLLVSPCGFPASPRSPWPR